MAEPRPWVARGARALALVLLAAPALRLVLRLWSRAFLDEPDPVLVLQAEHSSLLERWWLLGFLVTVLTALLAGAWRRTGSSEKPLLVALAAGLAATAVELAVVR